MTSTQNNASKKGRSNESGIYVLELSGNRFYVGKSERIKTRINDHCEGYGSSYTKKHGVIRQVSVMTRGSIDDLDSWERSETLERGFKHGISNVRGHMWVSDTLSKQHRKSFVQNICERKDLCRKCGKPGHMISACKSKFTSTWMSS